MPLLAASSPAPVAVARTPTRRTWQLVTAIGANLGWDAGGSFFLAPPPLSLQFVADGRVRSLPVPALWQFESGVLGGDGSLKLPGRGGSSIQ